ncbi:MAG: hypothetical protein KY468_07280 [Armatimonadetes bacterium]|nr:hypothetical protein [Armatimonadota bacterium]
MSVGWMIAGLLGSIPILLLFRWWSEGYLAATEFFGIAALFVVMFALLIAPTPPVGKLIVFLLLAGCSIGLPFIVQTLAKRDSRSLEQEREAEFRAAIETQPRNIAAREELARNLYKQGRRSEAIEEMERAVQLSPRTTQEEQRLLKRWLQEREAEPNPIYICRWCREETPKDRPTCIHCERPTHAVRELADAVKADFPATVRTFFLLLPILIIGAFIISILSGFAKAFLIAVMIAGALFWTRSRL